LDDQTYATPVIPGKHQSPVFDYRFHHNLMITESTIKYLKNNAICFKVFGSPDNEHRPYFEPDSGEGSTFQASEESKEIDTTAGEAPSEDFSLKDNFVNNISSENENENKSYEEKSKVKNYQEPEQEDVDLARADEEPHEELEPQAEEPEEDAPKRIEGNNANFDEMFIYGGQPNVDADGDDFGSRTYSQSVYQQPKALISDHEKAEYIASHPRDDHFIDSTSAGSGKKGKKGKKEKKGKKGKKDKDCVIF